MKLEGTLAFTEAQIDGAFDWIFNLVDRCRYTGYLVPCDRMLAGMTDPAVCSEIHTFLILTMLRLTATLREHLPSWRPARDVAARELEQRGEDVVVLLVGLRD